VPRQWREIAEAAPDGKGSPADASMPKNDLYNEARNAGIQGRSTMTKEQLVEALREHRARHHSRSEREPSGDIGSAEGARPRADARRPDRCAIVYKPSGRNGEFVVVVPGTGGSPTCVARSPAFRAPRFGPVRRWGPARVAHELLVWRLEACGWWAVDASGMWHESEFVRPPGEDERSVRSLITVVREAGQARFVAEELDTYGRPTPLLVSPAFDAPRFRRVRPSTDAKAALKQLVRRMESGGWMAGPVGKHWYAISLWQPVSATRGLRAPRPGAGRPAAEPA
jgi:hypothetical protein